MVHLPKIAGCDDICDGKGSGVDVGKDNWVGEANCDGGNALQEKSAKERMMSEIKIDFFKINSSSKLDKHSMLSKFYHALFCTQ